MILKKERFSRKQRQVVSPSLSLSIFFSSEKYGMLQVKMLLPVKKKEIFREKENVWYLHIKGMEAKT
ncbi:MAG: hypothetical protein JO031_10965 [Ktedonobacteraceae bacterium]|nr:hypothetical protein [Ktedonobacteraceae bacterium]